ncbi:MAG: site-2 protease family protein [Bacilli bacterium]
MFSFEHLIYAIPILLLSLTVHEYAHAFVSYKLGDKRIKETGRLSLDVRKHIDPIGFLALIILGFGWAKPVEVYPQYYKNKENGVFYVALAGPLSNLCLAAIGILIQIILLRLEFFNINIFSVLSYFWQINIALFIFNLIPVIPLDGSKILNRFLPNYIKELYEKINIFLVIILMFCLFFTGIFDNFLVDVYNKIIFDIIYKFGVF